jgi:two-component system, cell cycle sensor histidine kinase and response regulator CckA
VVTSLTPFQVTATMSDSIAIEKALQEENEALRHQIDRLRKSEEFYRNLIESASDLVQVIDAEGRFQYVNHAWKQTLGYSDEEVRGLSIFDLIHPDCLLQCRERFLLVVGGEPVDQLEFLLRAKDGRQVVVEGNSILGSIDGVATVQCIFRDVTVSRQTEEDLARLRQRNELLLESIGEGVLGVDLKGRHIFANQAAARMLGYQPSELLGKIDHATWHHTKLDGSHYPDEECPIKRNWRQGQSYHSDQEVFWRKDGSCFPVEYVSNPILERDRVVGAVITFADISERRRIEEESERLQTQLLQARKMQAIGTLAGGVAHDFNNILTAILGNLELAMLKSDSSKSNWKNLQNIKQVAERAVDLIGQLLLFSRKQPMEFAPIDLNRIVRGLGKMLQRIIGEDVTIRMELDSQLKPVYGSIINMEQVILNLAVNARDAMPRGGALIISTGNVNLGNGSLALPEIQSGEAVCLTVTDTGGGMDKLVQQHIFEPFYSTKEEGKGTGLGLAVVYGIIQEHRGWIQVDSEKGRGSSFRVFLPAYSGRPEKLRGPETAVAHHQGHGERILLVEDQEEVRQIAGIALSTNGYQVVLAEDAREARRLFSEQQGDFALVFSDVVLPDQSGVELGMELKTEKPALKILLSSGYTDDKSQLGVIRKQGLPFLAKPYGISALLEKVREVLDNEVKI